MPESPAKTAAWVALAALAVLIAATITAAAWVGGAR